MDLTAGSFRVYFFATVEKIESNIWLCLSSIFIVFNNNSLFKYIGYGFICFSKCYGDSKKNIQKNDSFDVR